MDKLLEYLNLSKETMRTAAWLIVLSLFATTILQAESWLDNKIDKKIEPVVKQLKTQVDQLKSITQRLENLHLKQINVSSAK